MQKMNQSLMTTACLLALLVPLALAQKAAPRSDAEGQEVTLESSRTLLRAGRLDEAQTVAESLLAESPADVAVRRQLAEVQRVKGNLDAARTNYEAVIADQGAPPYQVNLSRMGLARTAYTQRDLATVRSQASALVRDLPPGNALRAQAHTLIGDAARISNDLEAAESAYAQSISDAPGSVWAWRLLANVRSALGAQSEMQTNIEIMAWFRERGRIEEWQQPLHQAMFDLIVVRADQEKEYRDFCRSLNFLVLPVEQNVAIKTLLNRIGEGQ